VAGQPRPGRHAGVGGLNAAHAEIALGAAERASTPLFVTDAAAPLSAVELTIPYGRFRLDMDTRLDLAAP
jgi:hypothetical protein